MALSGHFERETLMSFRNISVSNSIVPHFVMLFYIEGEEYAGWLERELTHADKEDSARFWFIERSVSSTMDMDVSSWVPLRPGGGAYTTRESYDMIHVTSNISTIWTKMWSIKAPPKIQIFV